MVMGFYYLRGPIHNLSYFEEGVTVGKQSSRHLLDIYMPMKKKVGVEEGVGEDGSGGEEEKEVRGSDCWSEGRDAGAKEGGLRLEAGGWNERQEAGAKRQLVKLDLAGVQLRQDDRPLYSRK